MILESLGLIDFRCYLGRVDVPFSIDPERNTTVIEGTNGAGKTSILHALNFVLYGRDAVTSDSPLINYERLKTARENSPASATVILHFADGGRLYKLQRRTKGYLLGNVFRFASTQDEVSLTYTKPDGNTDRDPFPQQSIESMLPSAIRTFFLFDGDRIADFTKPGRERDTKIGEAVNEVLHIVALSRAIEDTAKIAGEKRRALDKPGGAPAVAKTNSEITVQEAQIERCRERLVLAEKTLREREDELSKIDVALASILAVARLAKERKDLDVAREGKLERASQLRRQLSRAIVAGVPALVTGKVKTAANILAKYKARHEIPARIQEYFLRDLLEKGLCICGRELDAGSSSREHLEALKNSLIPNSLQDAATQLSSRLRPMRDEVQLRVATIAGLLSEIEKNGIELGRIDRELERVGSEIDASAIDRAQTLNRNRTDLARQITQANSEHEREQRQLDSALSYRDKLNDKLKGELAKQTGFRELAAGWSVARECHEAFVRVKSILEERLRMTLGEDATEILSNLVSDSKKHFFSEIRIDPGFLLRVLDSDGRDVRSQLSMGETQVSSLAFMLAMTRLGGQQAPLVVDTPLARLDVSVRAHTAHWLPMLTSQLILLVTDAEFGPDVAAELAPKIGVRMRLNPTKTGTTVLAEPHG